MDKGDWRIFILGRFLFISGILCHSTIICQPDSEMSTIRNLENGMSTTKEMDSRTVTTQPKLIDDNYTTETVEEKSHSNTTDGITLDEIIPTLPAGMTLEEIDVLLGPPGPECMRQVVKPSIRQALESFFPNGTLNWALCRCYGLYCPGQTQEEFEKRNLEIASQVKIRYNTYTIAAIVSYGTVIAIGVSGNLIVLLTIFAILRPVSVTNMFIFSLSVADLLVCSICVPFRLYAFVMGVWLHGEAACKVIVYLYYALFMCSVFTLTAMSIERWFVICFPMKAQYISTVGRTRIIIVGTWILAFVMALPTAFNAGGDLAQCRIRSARPDDWSAQLFIFIFVGVFLAPCCVMGFAYFHTSAILWKSLKITKALKGTQENGTGKDQKGSSKEIRSRKQVIQMLISIWVIFVVCWGPYLLFELIDTNFDSVNKMPPHLFNHVYRALNLTTMVNSGINPILYALMSRQFRNGFLALITCTPLRTRRPDTTSTTLSKSTAVTSVSANVK